jgi:hypothetical protein
MSVPGGTLAGCKSTGNKYHFGQLGEKEEEQDTPLAEFLCFSLVLRFLAFRSPDSLLVEQQHTVQVTFSFRSMHFCHSSHTPSYPLSAHLIHVTHFFVLATARFYFSRNFFRSKTICNIYFDGSLIRPDTLWLGFRVRCVLRRSHQISNYCIPFLPAHIMKSPESILPCIRKHMRSIYAQVRKAQRRQYLRHPARISETATYDESQVLLDMMDECSD